MEFWVLVELRDDVEGFQTQDYHGVFSTRQEAIDKAEELFLYEWQVIREWLPYNRTC